MPRLLDDPPSQLDCAPSTARRWQLCLLDGFELRGGTKAVELPLTAQRLLAFLSFHERPVQRSYVAGRLWLDKSDERAAANLRSTIWRLQEPASGVVRAHNGQLALSDGVRVDVRDASHQARALVRGSLAVDADVNPDLLAGELLPDWYDDWVSIERERLRQLRLHALEALAGRLTACGRYGAAIDAALSAVAAEPLRESAHRTLIAVHLAEGNRIEAERQACRYRALLRECLGLEPSSQFEALVRRADATTMA